MNPILTVQLKNGLEVLAKLYMGEPCAVTYANLTQAQRKQAQMGEEWTVYRGTGRPFYVARKNIGA